MNFKEKPNNLENKSSKSGLLEKLKAKFGKNFLRNIK